MNDTDLNEIKSQLTAALAERDEALRKEKYHRDAFLADWQENEAALEKAGIDFTPDDSGGKPVISGICEIIAQRDAAIAERNAARQSAHTSFVDREEALNFRDRMKVERDAALAKIETLKSVVGSNERILNKIAAEVARLKAGDFTPEEFQNLCHKFSEADKEAFCNGCAEYQRKLFGEADIDRLTAEVAKLREALEIVEKDRIGYGHYGAGSPTRLSQIASQALKPTSPFSGQGNNSRGEG